MYVEVRCPMWERASNATLHDSFEGSEPIVQGVVEGLCGKTGHVGSEEDLGSGTLSDPSH